MVIAGFLCPWGCDGSHNGSCDGWGHVHWVGSCALRVITWVGSCVRGPLHGWGHVRGHPSDNGATHSGKGSICSKLFVRQGFCGWPRRVYSGKSSAFPGSRPTYKHVTNDPSCLEPILWVNSPVLPFLVFWKTAGKTTKKKQGFFIPAEPLKSLEKKGETLKKTKNSSQRTKTRNFSQKKNKERKDRENIWKVRGLPGI